jgi:6-phosphofructokinase 1
VGVIEEAAKHAEIGTLYGSMHAVVGMVKDDFIDLGALSAESLELVAASPSSAIGTSRDKPDAEYCAKILEVFKKRNIRYFFYIGGNDSANTAHILNTMADKIDFDIRSFHIPKTVDNDLRVTDHCPGFGTAAKFEACALMGDDLDNRALPGVKIDVIMGRHAGFLTAATALGRRRDDDGPHLLYFPERPVSMENFLADIDGVMSKLGRCVIAVSEGMCDEDGVTWAKKLVEQAETDARRIHQRGRQRHNRCLRRISDAPRRRPAENRIPGRPTASVTRIFYSHRGHRELARIFHRGIKFRVGN